MTMVTRKGHTEKQARIDFQLQVDNTSVDVVTWGKWAAFVSALDLHSLPCVIIFELFRIQEDNVYRCLGFAERYALLNPHTDIS